MKRNLLSKLTGLSAALLFSTTTLAAGQSADFQSLDKNSDGKLTASEVSEQDELRAQWNEIDQNSDGAIDREEFSAFEETGQRESEGMASQPMDFETLDQNQDGELSPAEASQDTELSQQWTEVDEDNSGTIDRAEFSAFEEQLQQESSPQEGLEEDVSPGEPEGSMEGEPRIQ